MMKTPDEIKKGIVEAIDEVSWVVEGGYAHDLQDACDKANASMADALAYIEQLETDNEMLMGMVKGHSKFSEWYEKWANEQIARTEAKVPKWISVEERLPEAGVFVLLQYAKNAQNPTLHARNTMAVGRYEYGMFLVEGCSVRVTHWMPLPEPPKEDAE